MENKTKIKCPKCETVIDVEDILSHQLEESLQKKYSAELAEGKKKQEKDFEEKLKAKIKEEKSEELDSMQKE